MDSSFQYFEVKFFSKDEAEAYSAVVEKNHGIHVDAIKNGSWGWKLLVPIEVFEFENKGVFLSGPKELDLIRARKAQKEMNSNLSDQPVFQLPKKKKICHICNGVKKIGIRSCSKCSGKGYL